MLPLVVLGGTFDPIHRGHLQSAMDICYRLELDSITLMPNGQPAHRQATETTPQQRLDMLQLAIADHHNLCIDHREMERQGASYTLDTLLELRQQHGDERPIIFCLGSDVFAGLPSWGQWQQLPNHAHLLILQRAKFDWPTDANLIHWYNQHRCDDFRQLMRQPAGCICSVTLGQYNISATQVRNSIASGQSATSKGWLTPAVAAYVAAHNLYTD